MNDPIGQKTLGIMAQASRYNTWLYQQIKPNLSGYIAEVGSGRGTFTQMLARDGYLVTTMDINPEYKAGINLDVQTPSLPKQLLNKFDTIVALNVVEHIDQAGQALANFYRMLKPKGKLVVLVPQGKWAYGSLDKNLGHFRRYDRDELTNLISQAGLTINSLKSLNFFGIWGWWWNSKVIHQTILPSWQVKLFDNLVGPWLWLEQVANLPWGLSLLAVATK